MLIRYEVSHLANCVFFSLSLGKDGIHSLSHWSADVGRALETKVNQYISMPNNVDVGRRNTVFGGESPDDGTHMQALMEEDVDDQPAPKVTLGRAMSTRSLGLRAEVPHGVDTARSSIATINMLPPSATATLFELEGEIGNLTPPQAESTPHNTVVRKRISDDGDHPMPSPRRSSIVYIKDEDHAQVTPPQAATTSTMTSLAQWSSRAVRPLMPKASRLQRKPSTMDSSAKTSTPGRGLRPLSLLQDRDSNVSGNSPVVQDTRPLQLGKKQKSKTGALRVRDENTNPDPLRSSKSKGLKPLQLARSETSKMRGILRQEEDLPDVVVRPPSSTVHQAYAYSFRD